MHRNVTAIYRTRDVAALVQRGLEEIGVSANDIHIIPDPTRDVAGGSEVRTPGTTTGLGAGAAPAGTTAAGARAGAMPGDATAPRHEHPLQTAGFLDDPAHSDRLHDLNLPEDDLRTYQHAVRRGDYVVSVEVDDAEVARVQEIMRRPEEEVYRLEDRDAEFSRETVVPHSMSDEHVVDEEMRARRLTSQYDPHARIYERGAPLRQPRRSV